MSVVRELRRRLGADPARSRFEPCLPRFAKEPPAGPGWIHEIKHDGFRIVAHRDTRSVRLIRSGFEFRIGNILAVAIVGALFALTPLATFAQSPPGPAGPVTASPKSGWSIIEDKSATGESAQFSAWIIVGDAALILRCREQPAGRPGSLQRAARGAPARHLSTSNASEKRGASRNEDQGGR